MSLNYIYPLHGVSVQEFVENKSSLYCEPLSLRVVIATSSDAQSSHGRRNLIYKVLYQCTIYVISLSNISIIQMLYLGFYQTNNKDLNLN